MKSLFEHITRRGKSFPQNAAADLREEIGEQTVMAAPLSDSEGNEITQEELRDMLGTEIESSIGVMQDMSPIGMGGIGSVFSAREPGLNREIAIKILRPAFRNQLNYVTSFIREARITAQIDHPNVIPVHRLGIFDDSGVYFTMKRVRGVTLANILRKLKENDPETTRTYTRQRLLEIFISICNGVAFAHSKGIIHRDLKPANIMVGNYGEVFIADWGLAIYREDQGSADESKKIKLGELPPEKKTDDPEGGNKISGTPAFMAPEQIAGNDDELDGQTDVYALGTILYSILTWEQSPYENASTMTELMQYVTTRKILRPRRRAPKRKIPYELEAITLKAMSFNKSGRYHSVIDLLNDVRNYLAKYPVTAYSPLPLYRLYKLIRRRPLVPMTLIAALLTLAAWHISFSVNNYLEAKSLKTLIASALEDGEKNRNTALVSRKQLNDFFARTGKTETYGNASALRSRYLRSSNEFAVACNNAWEHLQKLQHLQQLDNHFQAAPLYARLLSGQMQFGIAVGNQAMTTQAADRLRQLPQELVKEIFQLVPSLAHQIQLQQNNQGELLLDCAEPGVVFTAAPLNLNSVDSKTSEETLIKLESVPAVNTLKAGSYLISAKLPDGRELRFPAAVERDQQEMLQINIPANSPENMVYIPGGSFIFGDRTFDEQHARTQLPDFFIARYEVTLAEYLDFWRSVSDLHLRERFRAYVDAPDGGRKLVPLWDDNGNLLTPYTAQMPVIGITAEAVEAYCSYMSAKTAMKYRLPTALEWEKAARGVDGRDYVWGNEYHDDYARVNRSGQFSADNRPAAVGTYPYDCSVYGIFDLTGNARELVTNPGNVQYYSVKGSSFNLSQRFARASAHAYASNLSDVGFRCVVEP